MFKVEADYDPDHHGWRTEPGVNGIEYLVESRILAEQIAERYVLLSQERSGTRWIETGDGTYELAYDSSDEPIQNIHARIDDVDVLDEMPDVWTADDRRAALEEANA